MGRDHKDKNNLHQTIPDNACHPEIISSPRPFFTEVISTSLQKRKIETSNQTKFYLVDLLEHYMFAANLFLNNEAPQRNQTLAETYLQSFSAEPSMRMELLKKLGDTALYVSGFFGDSLQKKIIDIDYYVDIGGSAYNLLSRATENHLTAQVFNDLSSRFLDYMDLLTHISQQLLIQSNQDILRLYDRFLSTGSKLAQEQLIERGVLTTKSANKTHQ
ncbi:MAG: hypothetical protein K1X29_00885 [Bdellovibrionales bacterium]|nr:hypothetical protein [Bdellovibrionales bacterium]